MLAKTAYSPLLKVAGDYSCGLFDVRGEMVAQGPDLPIHLGSMPLAVKAVIQASPDLRARRRVHPQRSLLRRQPSARRQRGHSGLPRGPAARLRLRARALAGHRQRYARLVRRQHRDLRRGPAPAARASLRRRRAQSRGGRDHLHQRPHARRAPGRSPRAAGGQPPRCTRLSELARRYGAERAAGDHAGGDGLLRAHDARAAGRAARRHRRLRGFLRRRRRAGERRQGGPAVLDPHADRQAGRPSHGGLRRDRRARWRAR